MSELESISQKLQLEGIDPSCPDEEKILHLWKIYSKTESQLKDSRDTINVLQEQQAEEMKEFENYVEHVKNLSKEREALTVEFAAENDGLKAENDQLRQELESYKNDETRDMLLQQGLDDIAHSTASEQIAYLLVERARLMDELDAVNDQSVMEAEGKTGASDVMKQLQQERKEFEDELRQQRDNMNRTRENLRAGHEEEMSALMEENEHLQELLDQARSKLTQNTEEIPIHNELPSYLKNTKDSQGIKSGSSKDGAKLARLEELEQENGCLAEDVQRLKVEVQKEKERSNDHCFELEEENRKLREETLLKDQSLRKSEGLEVRVSHLEKQLLESQEKLEEVKLQKNTAELELSHQQNRNILLQSQTDNTASQLDKLTSVKRELETENEELFKKLSDTKKECVQKERDLIDQRDLLMSQDRRHDVDDRLTKAHTEIDDLQQQVFKINAELRQKQDKIFQLELELDSEKAHSENNTSTLRNEINLLKRKLQEETEDITHKLEKAEGENKKLRLASTEKQKEIERLRDDISKRKLSDDVLSSSATESEMAFLNKHEKDSAQLRMQRDYYKKSAVCETSTEQLQTELDQKILEIASMRAELAELKGGRSAETLIAEASAETYKKKSDPDLEKKLLDLQGELSETRQKFIEAEKNSSQVSLLKTEVRLKTDEIIQLRNQLQDEQFKKLSNSSSSEEANQQILLLKQRESSLQKRNNELQHMLLDVEGRLETMKLQTRSNADVRQEAESSKQSLQEQYMYLELEAESLRVDLLKLNDKYDNQLQKYNERKMKTKVQLLKARDHYNGEKSKLRDEVDKLERELKLTKSMLAKELEWKDTVGDRHHALLQENRDLMMQLTEQGETVRDHSRQLSVLQVRCKFLEDENNSLQQRVDSLVRQKQNLDRIIKEYQFERHKEELQKILTLNTSVLVSPRSFVASFDSESSKFDPSGRLNGGEKTLMSSAHNLEAILSPRKSQTQHSALSKLNQTAPNLIPADDQDFP